MDVALKAGDRALVSALVGTLRDGTRLTLRVRRNPGVRRYRLTDWTAATAWHFPFLFTSPTSPMQTTLWFEP